VILEVVVVATIEIGIETGVGATVEMIEILVEDMTEMTAVAEVAADEIVALGTDGE